MIRSVLFTALVLNAIHVEVNRDDKPSKSLAVRLPRREMEICLKTEEIPRYVENKDKTRRQHEYILLILTTCEKVFEEKFDQFKDQAKDGFIKLNQKFQEEIDKLQKLLTEELQEIKTCIKKDVAEITENITNLRNLTNQFRNESNGRIKELKNDTETVITTIKDAINEVPILTNYTIVEIKKIISDFGTSIWIVCILETICVIYLCSKWIHSSQQRKKDPELPELNLENSVAVVSFTERNIDRHLRIARTVTGDYPIHPTYVGGVNNVKSIELNSKVCLVFVDKNTRDIILETELDVSQTRFDFVEGQVERDSTKVIVIYYQDVGSRNLKTLYNRNLKNIQQHSTLWKLQRQNRVLSIYEEFSLDQSLYLKMFINETLIE